MSRPELNESPVTLELIKEILEAHPDYRRVSHVSPSGHRFTVIEYAKQDGRFLRGAPSAIVEFIEGIEGDHIEVDE